MSADDGAQPPGGVAFSDPLRVHPPRGWHREIGVAAGTRSLRNDFGTIECHHEGSDVALGRVKERELELCVTSPGDRKLVLETREREIVQRFAFLGPVLSLCPSFTLSLLTVSLSSL